jgi:hypothetical protein
MERKVLAFISHELQRYSEAERYEFLYSLYAMAKAMRYGTDTREEKGVRGSFLDQSSSYHRWKAMSHLRRAGVTGTRLDSDSALPHAAFVAVRILMSLASGSHATVQQDRGTAPTDGRDEQGDENARPVESE